MHIVLANLSAVYSGRGNSILPPYDRMLLIKEDGSVSIHGDKGFKPMNYMVSKTEKTESYTETGELVWTFDSRNESLKVVLHKVYEEITFRSEEGADPGVSADTTEKDLQSWLAESLTKIDENLSFIEREYQTGDGTVDILAEHSNGALVAIEVKRVAPMGTVGQVLRYTDALKEKIPSRRIEGTIAALEIKDKTRTLAKKKGVSLMELPEDWRESQDSPDAPES